MPWRGPELPGEFPSLGYLVGEYIEAWCVVPDGDHQGDPYRLTDEMWRFLVWYYRLHPQTGRFVYRRAQLVKPQKYGKGPFSSAIVCAEADDRDGPVLFDGWDARGEPVGRPWATPWIQITAASEDQTDNVWRALQPMIELGPLANRIPDTGETRINLPGGGRIEPVTAAARSRLGQRITLAVQDETQSWTDSNGGRKLADTQWRNLAGMNGRSIETTNAWDPSERSVAQVTAETAAPDVFRDHTLPPDLSIANKRELRRMLKAVYGDSWWVDLIRIEAEFRELMQRDAVQAQRFFLNRVVATAGSWIDGAKWDMRHQRRRVPDGAQITLGFDGSRYDDWTVIRAETEDGYQFTPTFADDNKPTIWNPADTDGEVPEVEVDAAVHELFDRYDVVLMYANPMYWQSEIDAWATEWDERVVSWDTRRDKQMSDALERLHTDLMTGAVTHDGCPITAVHVRNAKKQRRRGGTVIVKDYPQSPNKIDAAQASALSHEARADALTLKRFGAKKKRARRLATFASR